LRKAVEVLLQENELLKSRLRLKYSNDYGKNRIYIANEVNTIDNSSNTGIPKKASLSQHASTHTFKMLRSLQPQSCEDDVAFRMLARLRSVDDNLRYLNSRSFAVDLLHLAKKSLTILESEWRCLFLNSPLYVIGDIHGNIEDLSFFADYLWGLGMGITAGKFLFLGDYVDRGKAGLEVIAYLLALKVLHPEKIYLLRGNHETRASNGWEEQYGDDCFLAQCKQRFGIENGSKVWEGCNQVFDRMPLAAVIDDDIFCCHGGLPRRTASTNSGSGICTPRIHDILHLPNIMAITPRYEFETDAMNRIAMDILWGDPVKEGHEDVLGEDGFGQSLRGKGATCFGQKAVDDFLAEHNFSYIIRAHEAHSQGVSLRMSAKVFTVFSTSRDHGQGSKAQAGCILVDSGCIKFINKSSSYRNKFIHRVTSNTFLGASPSIMDLREKLGLVDHTIDEHHLDRNNMMAISGSSGVFYGSESSSDGILLSEEEDDIPVDDEDDDDETEQNFFRRAQMHRQRAHSVDVENYEEEPKKTSPTAPVS